MFVTVGKKLDEIEKGVMDMANETGTKLAELEAAIEAANSGLADLKREVGQVSDRIGAQTAQIADLLAQLAADPGNAAKVVALTARVQELNASVAGETAKLDAVSGTVDVPPVA
jgi:septal ring factor EnvC (AmiA/AmiB activator)